MGIYGDEYQAAVARELQGERAIVGFTYDDLASSSGLNTQTVMRYLTGKRDIPMTALFEICKALGVTASEIFERAERRITK